MKNVRVAPALNHAFAAALRLCQLLESRSSNQQAARSFVVHTIICLLAERCNLLADKPVSHLVSRVTPPASCSNYADASKYVTTALASLFHRLSSPPPSDIPADCVLYHLFYHDNKVPYTSFYGEPVPPETAQSLVECCTTPWHTLDPSAVASLLCALLIDTDRRPFGQHYTRTVDVLNVIGPLFLDNLRDRLCSVHNDPEGLVDLLDHVANIKTFDPACGCGSFLLVAQTQLFAIYKRIISRLDELHVPIDNAPAAPALAHYIGIEQQPWSAKIASAMLVLTHQWLWLRAGILVPPSDSLHPFPIPTIHIDNALQLDWANIAPRSKTTYIVGNPPFIGARRMSRTQKHDMKCVFAAKGSHLDYAAAWFQKAFDYFASCQYGQFAFVSTSSLFQGMQASLLFGNPLDNLGWRIRFAHKSFAWRALAFDKAAVHCTIAGFDKSTTQTPILFSMGSGRNALACAKVANINAYLVDGPNVTLVSRTSPLCTHLPTMQFGSMPNDNGALIVEQTDYATALACPIASKYLREFPGAKQILHNKKRWCLWLQEASASELNDSPFLRKRLAKCAQYRSRSKRKTTRDLAATPHLFGECRQPTAPYVTLPRHVSSSRPYFIAVWTPQTVIAADSNFTAIDPDGLLFSIVSSSMFLTWLRSVGGRLGNGLRLSASYVWNNFPLPSTDEATKHALKLAGKQVLQARNPNTSLASQYRANSLSSQLAHAHQHLDYLVDSIFGSQVSHPMTESDRQAALFRSYELLTQRQS